MDSKQLNSYETIRKNIIGNTLDYITESHLKSLLIQAVHHHFNYNLRRNWAGIPVKKDGTTPQNLHYSRLPSSTENPRKVIPPKCTPIPVNTPEDFCRLQLMNEMKDSEFSLATVDLSSLLTLVISLNYITINDRNAFSEQLVEYVKEVRRVRNDWAHQSTNSWTREKFLEAAETINKLAKTLKDNKLEACVIDMKKSEPTNCDVCCAELKDGSCSCCSLFQPTLLGNKGITRNRWLEQVKKHSKEIQKRRELLDTELFHPKIIEKRKKQPDIFLGPFGEDEMSRKNKEEYIFDSINKAFETDECFIYHRYKVGLPKEVVTERCNELSNKLKSNPEEIDIFENVRQLRKLAMLEEKQVEDADKEITKLCEDVKNYEKEPVTLIINLTMKAIICCSLIGANQQNKIKTYLEELNVDTEMTGSWTFIGLRIHEDKEAKTVPESCCAQCNKHNICITELKDIRTKVKYLLKSEENQERDVADVEDPDRNQRWLENFKNLVYNITLSSSMELLPFSHQVGKVTGAREEVQGPGDKEFYLLNSVQKFLKDNPPEKAVIRGDFGVGKSMMLHHFIFSVTRKYPGRKNFLISFLNCQSGGTKRGVLDINNRMRYRDEMIEVIDARDILEGGKNLRKRLSLKSRKPTSSAAKDLLFFLKDLTENYINCNIAVDEVEPEILLEQKALVLHHKNFVGSIWIALSSKSIYDFIDATKETELDKLIKRIKEKEFRDVVLKENMRNGRLILEKSNNLQKDKLIEAAIIPASNPLKRNQSSEPLVSATKRIRTDYENNTENITNGLIHKHCEKFHKIDENIESEVSHCISLEGKESQKLQGEAADEMNIKDITNGHTNQNSYTYYKIDESKTKEVSHCPTLEGKEPQKFRGEEAEKFLKQDVAKMVKEKKVMVMLGKDEKDVRWISHCLQAANVTQKDFTEYDGSQEMEEELQDFFTSHKQVLLTTADLFDGMESPTVVYAYNDPYPWPRRTFLRAIQTLILLDRNVEKETDPDKIKQTLLGQ